jgi:hypothetical protein
MHWAEIADKKVGDVILANVVPGAFSKLGLIVVERVASQLAKANLQLATGELRRKLTRMAIHN